jgi:hypothetical protein
MKTVKYEFVEFIPDKLEDWTIYISLIYATAAHKCCCGCGNEIITPLSPTDWKLIFDGESVSLNPSIGNWHLPCRSHYWITNNKIVWAKKWSEKQIKDVRDYSSLEKQNYYNKNKRYSIFKDIFKRKK